jgi:hypothetical protein
MKIKSTPHLSKEEVSEILIEHLKSKGFLVENFSFKMGTRTVGFGMHERDEKVFDGVSFDTITTK